MASFAELPIENRRFSGISNTKFENFQNALNQQILIGFAQKVVKSCISMSFSSFWSNFVNIRFFTPLWGRVKFQNFAILCQFESSAKENWLYINSQIIRILKLHHEGFIMNGQTFFYDKLFKSYGRTKDC